MHFNDNFARAKLESYSCDRNLMQRTRFAVSSVAQVYNSSLHPLSTVEDLYVEFLYSQLVWKNDAIEDTLWLQF